MLDIELKIKSRDFNTLLEIIKKNRPDADIELIKSAYNYADEAHKDQKRLSGEPFIIHPLEVGIILALLKMDTPTIIAALLHDVVEDTRTSLNTISKLFGEDVSSLVDGVTKISTLKKKTKEHEQAHTLRKMLLATIKDARVIIIKLADKTHNMRTLMFQPRAKQIRIANEVLDIYAPLAGRLGMSKIRSELEDLAFKILHKDEYIKIKENLASRQEHLENYIDNVRKEIQSNLEKQHIEADIQGRIKHNYSIYRKMISQKKTFNDIFDIRAIRIVTNQVKDCYGILGIVHTLWSPVPSRFKDYIAVPKSNMYQSLHTTVIGPENHFLEIQIRTHEMNITAEMGIAAHWAYKENNKQSKENFKNMALLQEIAKWQNELHDTKEFMKELKLDLYEDEIFVFTPKGKIVKLGKGATPVDFAYAIHTEIGHHCTGAKVNHKICPLKTQLVSGDIVEVITSPKGHPAESWLKFVRSSNARYKIRNWLRKKHIEENESQKNNATRKQKTKTAPDDVTATVSIPDKEILKIKKYNPKNKTGILVEGNSNILIKLSQCCQPIPGDSVVGFITRGRGITIHKTKCPSLKRLKDEKERFIDIMWVDSEERYPVKIAIHALDRPNLLKDLANEISLLNTNILKMEAQTDKDNRAILKLIIEVNSVSHMNDIIKKINQIKNVTEVYKMNEKVVLK